jgi:hypothetical protein
MGSINLSSNLLQTALSSALQSVGLANNTTSTSSGGSTAAAGQSDNTQLSPFAQLMNTLQQLQQSDPGKYTQVTQQISTKLQAAAQSATTSGNTAAASQLTQLASDFSTASTTGQLPNVADLAKALGGGGGHHHRHSASSGDSISSPGSTAGSSTGSSTGSTSTSSGSSANQLLSQLFSAFQANSSQNTSTNPMTIIMSTLSSAGVTNTAG